jgi:coatomer protein complex subunit alpha (xenin)
MQNAVLKSFKSHCSVSGLFQAMIGHILIATATHVQLYDVQQRVVVAELAVTGVKFALWTNDMATVALIGKHSKQHNIWDYIQLKLVLAITVASNKLEQLAFVHETLKIKSAVWDDIGVLIYSTLSHLKYALPQG